MEIEPYFKDDIYNTSENTPRKWMDYVFLGSRWYFVGAYLGEIWRARSLAVKNLYNRNAWANSSFRILKLIESCGGNFHLRGLKNIHSLNGPVVFISNHMSTLETFVFPCIIAPFMKVTYVVKESLVNHSLFGPVMKARYPIVIARKDPREDFRIVMDKGKKLLDNGVSVIIFPQSTRMAEFDPRLFNSMGIKLATASGVKVIPVAIKTDFWGNGRMVKEIGPVNRDKPIYMTFGEPIEIKGNGKEEHRRISDFIVGNLQQWGATVKCA
jgi:1-acyl-sn-glycerol-3-phosphate acyltransferase